MFLYDARLLFVMGVFAFLTPIIATLFPDSFLGRLVFRGWKRPITGKSKRAMYVLGVGISVGGFIAFVVTLEIMFFSLVDISSFTSIVIWIAFFLMVICIVWGRMLMRQDI